MIRISQLKLPVDHSREDLEKKIEKTLRIPMSQVKNWQIVRQSVDARKKEELLYIYTIDVKTGREEPRPRSPAGFPFLYFIEVSLYFFRAARYPKP